MRNHLSRIPMANFSSTIDQPRQKIPHQSDYMKRKQENGLPKVHDKEFPLHYIYDVPTFSNEPSEKQYSSLQLDWWADTSNTKHNIRQNKITLPKKAKLSLFDLVLNKYALRKSRQKQYNVRIVTSQSKEHRKTSQKVLKRFQASALQEFRKKSKSLLKNANEQPNPQSQQEFTLTHYDVASLYNKNLHQMTKQQLQQSMIWKKKFLMALEARQVTSQQNQQNKRNTSISFGSIKRW